MKQIAALALSVVVLSACGGGNANNFQSSPSDGSGSGGSGGTGTGGTVQTVGIYAKLLTQTQPIVSYMHQFNHFGLDCSIPSSAGSRQDIQCLLNVRELDLYEQGLKLEFNAAAGMCDYVTDEPYYYYYAEAGFGPTYVNIVWDKGTSSNNFCEITKNNGTKISTTANPTLVQFDDVTGTCTFPGGTIDSTGVFTSVYDHTQQPGDVPGPNCVDGKYTFQKRIVDASPTVPPIIGTTPGLSWGGKLGNCIQSPGKASGSGWRTNANGIPMVTYHPAQAGLNQYYTIKAPISFVRVGNFYAANFFGWAEYAAGNQAAATMPNGMSYSTDRLGNVLYKPTSAYTFTCYDTAEEVKHSVRIYINEWDKSSEFLGYGVGGNTTTYSPIANPSATCDYAAGDCDDETGWSRIPTGFPGGDYRADTGS